MLTASHLTRKKQKAALNVSAINILIQEQWAGWEPGSSKFSSGTFPASKMTLSIDPEMKSSWKLIGEKSDGIVITYSWFYHSYEIRGCFYHHCISKVTDPQKCSRAKQRRAKVGCVLHPVSASVICALHLIPSSPAENCLKNPGTKITLWIPGGCIAFCSSSGFLVKWPW